MNITTNEQELHKALKKLAYIVACYGTGDGTKHVDETTGEPITPLMKEVYSALENTPTRCK